MEHIRVHRGKKKYLHPKRKNIKIALTDDQRLLALFYERYNRFENLIEAAVSSLYKDAIDKIAAFVQTQWQADCFSDLIPTGVFCLGNVEGICLGDSLSHKIGVEPICISSPVPALYSVISRLRENSKPKYVILEHFESLPIEFFDALISLVVDDSEIPKVVFLIGLSVGASNIYSRCSLESYTHLTFRYFDFPTPKAVLNRFLDAVAFTPDAEFLVDKNLFEMLSSQFLNFNYSLAELKKIVKMAALECTDEDFLYKQSSSQSQLDVYKTLLSLLFQLNKDLSTENLDRNDLHVLVQQENFFCKENSIFQKWRSFWTTFDAAHMVKVVRELSNVLKDRSAELYSDLESFRIDLLHIEDRESEARRNSKIKSGEHKEDESRVPAKGWIGFRETRANLEKSIEERKKFNILGHDQQRFANILTKIFSRYLLPYHQLAGIKTRLLRGSSIINDLCFPNFKADMEHDISRVVNLGASNKQLDVCIAYRLVQRMVKARKKIVVDEWLSLLNSEVNDLLNCDSATRGFRCLGELELLGIVRSVNERDSSAFQVLQIPFSCIV